MENNKPVIQLFKSKTPEVSDYMELLASKELVNDDNNKELLLQIKADENLYSFQYSFEPSNWQTLKDSVDAEFLSTKIAGGFVGCMFALYATSSGKPSDNIVDFGWFKYKGEDKVYK